MRAQLVPAALAAAYQRLDEGRLVVGVIVGSDHLRVLSLPYKEPTQLEQAYIRHPNPWARAAFQIAGLRALDRMTK